MLIGRFAFVWTVVALSLALTKPLAIDGVEASEPDAASPCWYAVALCYHRRETLETFQTRLDDGRVISAGVFPHLHEEFYCLAEGPFSKAEATSRALSWTWFAPGASSVRSC